MDELKFRDLLNELEGELQKLREKGSFAAVALASVLGRIRHEVLTEINRATEEDVLLNTQIRDLPEIRNAEKSRVEGLLVTARITSLRDLTGLTREAVRAVLSRHGTNRLEEDFALVCEILHARKLEFSERADSKEG